MEDDGDFDGGGDTPEPEDTSSRARCRRGCDLEQDRGDPDPQRSDRGIARFAFPNDQKMPTVRF